MPQSVTSLRQRRAIGLVLMSAFLPGSAQVIAGNRRVGRLFGRVFGVAIAVCLVIGLAVALAPGPMIGWLVRPPVVLTARIALIVAFVIWLGLLLDSWRLARPLRLARRGRAWLMLLSIGLTVAVGAATTLAANALSAVGNVAQVFEGGGDAVAKEGRYNVLLLGADAADDREGLRPDSINVASIDAETGRTVLFGLPRNLERVRFPVSSPLDELYPDGYWCEDSGCMLNGIYALGMENADLYPGQHAGRTAMKEAVGETLGIELNYYVLIDMHGFESLIDAMGGIRVNVSKPIPIGGGSSKVSGYIGPGENLLLDGYHALWLARSRHDSSDYERMTRQKCVLSAMAKQLDPQTIATKFLELSEAGADIVSTDIGAEAIVELTDLGLKAKDLPIVSVDFSPPLIHSADPDFDLIRATVTETLAEAEALDGGATGSTRSAESSASATPPDAGGNSASAEPSEPDEEAETPDTTEDTGGPVCSVP